MRPSCHQLCVVTAWPGSLGRLFTSKHTHSSGQSWNKVNLEQVASQKAKWGISRDLKEDDLRGSRGEPQLVQQGGVGRWDTGKKRKQDSIHCTPLAIILFNFCFISVLFLWPQVDQHWNCTMHMTLPVSTQVCVLIHTHNTWHTKQAA